MMILNYDKAELKALKDNYFISKAFYETIKEQTEEIQKKILAENEFYVTDDMMKIIITRGGTEADRRILKPFATYKMSNDDFKKYPDLYGLQIGAYPIAKNTGKYKKVW